MRDGVPANRACATLKPYDLAFKAIIARQDDAATVQKRKEIAEQFTLGLLGQYASRSWYLPPEQTGGVSIIAQLFACHVCLYV